MSSAGNHWYAQTVNSFKATPTTALPPAPPALHIHTHTYVTYIFITWPLDATVSLPEVLKGETERG